MSSKHCEFVLFLPPWKKKKKTFDFIQIQKACLHIIFEAEK